MTGDMAGPSTTAPRPAANRNWPSKQPAVSTNIRSLEHVFIHYMLTNNRSMYVVFIWIISSNCWLLFLYGPKWLSVGKDLSIGIKFIWTPLLTIYNWFLYLYTDWWYVSKTTCTNIVGHVGLWCSEGKDQLGGRLGSIGCAPCRGRALYIAFSLGTTTLDRWVVFLGIFWWLCMLPSLEGY